MEMKVYCSLAPGRPSCTNRRCKTCSGRSTAADGIQRRGLGSGNAYQAQADMQSSWSRAGRGTLLAQQSGKLLRLQEMLEEVIAEGDSALIFTQFAEFGHKLQSFLEQSLAGRSSTCTAEPLAMSGSVLSLGSRISGRGSMIFLLSLRAGGTGLNLTRANHVFHYDRWWNPAVEDQATDRAFRIGQTRDVQVHKLITLGTLEEHIDNMLESKKALAGQIVGTGEGWLTELSTTELRDVLRLRRDVVGVAE